MSLLLSGPMMKLPVVGGGGGISYVGGVTATNGTGATFSVSLTSLTGGSDTSPSANDVVIVVLEESGDRDVTSSSLPSTTGYTTEVSLNHKNIRDANLKVHWKAMGGTPDTQIDFASGFSGLNGRAVGIMVFRGVNTSTPFDVTTTTATGSGVAADPPSITPVSSGAWVLGVGGAGTRNGTPADFTSSDFTTFLSTNINDSYDAIVGIGYDDTWTSGAVDPAAFGGGASGGSDEAWIAASLVLKPA